MPAPESSRPPLSVSQLVGVIRNTLQTHLGRVRVAGEISNFSVHRSGHCYFTLKDDRAQIQCVMFRSDARKLQFRPADGMQVEAVGRADVYAARGTLQLRTVAMRSAGEGALQKAFEQLKRRLGEEGLFDPAKKKPLPPFPRVVGLVTSGSGAALKDLLTVIGRRYPLTEVLLYPVSVQGFGAAEDIAHGIRNLNVLHAKQGADAPDVLIVGRGGGSAEDLWAFNEEVVARAIFESDIPVVSAVGHETDFTIADFVSDVRAPTPSAAAEMVVPDRVALRQRLLSLMRSGRSTVLSQIDGERYRVRRLLYSPGMTQPLRRLEQYGQSLDERTARMGLAIERRLNAYRDRATALQRHLEALDPRRILGRGYVWIEKDGKPVVRAGQTQPGDEVSLRFVDGMKEARILP